MAVAADVYGVRLVTEPLTVRRARVRAVLSLMASVLAGPFGGLPDGGRQDATVEVLRRTDGAVVASFPHRRIEEAVRHRDSIEERAARLEQSAFEAELGIEG